MRTSSSLARNIWLAAAVLWTFTMGVLCLISFDALPVKIKSGSVDKLVHFIFHFLFAVGWGKYAIGVRFRKTILMRVILASLLYGVALELAQEAFTTTRGADLCDVAANLVGSLCGAALLWRVHRKN